MGMQAGRERALHAERFSRICSLLIGALMLLAFCGALADDASALSTEDERILGEQFRLEIHRYFQTIDDAFANEFLRDLGRYLLQPLETKPFDFTFSLIKDNTLNAFAGPGGHIFIFSGLVEVMDGVDELGAVICHEIGHVTARHLAQRIEQGKKIGIATMAGILAGILLGGGPVAEALISGSMAAGIQAQLQYSRTDERQADQLSFKYMEAGGFDPAGMLSTLKKIDRGQWLGTDKVPAYLLTHPTGPERMAAFDAMLGERRPPPVKEEAQKFRRLFPAFKAVVRARAMEPATAERLFKDELRKRPGDPFANLGLGLVYQQKSEYDLAIPCFRKASEEGSTRLASLRYLAETFQLKGRPQEALATLQEALKPDPRDPETLFLLATTHEALGQYTDAVVLLERLAGSRGARGEVFYHLGLSYGKLERLGPAHYNFGLYFKRIGQMEKARFHLDKAEALSRDDPAFRERIRQARQGMS